MMTSTGRSPRSASRRGWPRSPRAWTPRSASAARTSRWASGRDVARDVDERHANSRYLEGFTLPDGLHATADLEEATSGADVLVVGIPSHAFREVLQQAAPHIRPWVPVVSLTKGFERGS